MLLSESVDSEMRQWMDAQTYMVVMNEWIATEITVIIYMRIWRNGIGLDKHHSCSYLTAEAIDLAAYLLIIYAFATL